MKKLISLLLVLAMALSLVACGGKTEAPAEEAPAEDELPRSCDLCKANALSALTMAVWQCDTAARTTLPAEAAAEEEEAEEE